MRTKLANGFEVSTTMEVNDYIEVVHQYIIWWHVSNHNAVYLMQSDFIFTSEEMALNTGLQKVKELCNQTIEEINSITQ